MTGDELLSQLNQLELQTTELAVEIVKSIGAVRARLALIEAVFEMSEAEASSATP